jgi:hypothetical protein
MAAGRRPAPQQNAAGDQVVVYGRLQLVKYEYSSAVGRVRAL